MIDASPSPLQQNKDRSFIMIVLLILMANVSYMMMIPLFPPLIKEKGFSEGVIGIIMCFYPIGSISTSWKLGKMHTDKKIIFKGLIAQSIICVILGISFNFDGTTFLFISLILRFLQGVSNTMIQVPSYSITGHLFPDEVQEKIGILEMACNFGLVCGPLLSGILNVLGDIYNFNTFQYSFYLVSVLYLLISIGVTLFMDDKIFRVSSSQQQIFIDYHEVFQIHELNLTFTSYFFICVTSQAIRTYLSVQLLDVYELNEANSKFFFLLYTIVSFIGSLIVAEQRKYTLNRLFTLCLFSGAISLIFYGATMIGLPQSIFFVSIADMLCGFSVGSATATVMPLIVEIMEKKKHKDQASEIGSTLLIAGWSLGDLIGPIIGGLFIDKFGFDQTSVIMSGTLFVISYVYSKTSHIDQDQGIEMQILIH